MKMKQKKGLEFKILNQKLKENTEKINEGINEGNKLGNDKQLIEAQISSDCNKIFDVIPKTILRSINCNITNHSMRSIRKLHKIREELETRQKENVKVKKLVLKEK